MTSNRKRVTVRYTSGTASVAGAIEDAYSVFAELRDEMEDWRSNMEEKLGSTDKYSRVEECAQALDEFADNSHDVPSCISDETVQFQIGKKVSKKSPYPRHLRLSNAVNQIEAALEATEQMIDAKTLEKDEDGKGDEEIEKLEEEISELEELKNNLEEDKDSAGNVEFPGMFG